MPNIQVIDIAFNKNLTGFLPKFHSGSKLKLLNLYFTSFSGILPDSIGDLKSLNELYVSGCNFSGTIPASVGNLSRLVILDLEDNNFNGHLPATLGNLSQLEALTLLGNNLNEYARVTSPCITFQRISWANMGSSSIFGLREVADYRSLLQQFQWKFQWKVVTQTGSKNWSAINSNVPTANKSNLSYMEAAGEYYQDSVTVVVKGLALEFVKILCGFPLSEKCDTTNDNSQESEAESDSGFGWKPVLTGYGCGIVIGLIGGHLIISNKPRRAHKD
ncbi:LRR domain containing protein [Parasponia andersonii]|uniref:LRR domain containing protein n=1 Tax=Parasponia andersonii TaxID=3476 RepID=A0A2P5D1D9_PARAD|nr:LRR domain containing protein [Parasponia andersonii]